MMSKRTSVPTLNALWSRRAWILVTLLAGSLPVAARRNTQNAVSSSSDASGLLTTGARLVVEGDSIAAFDEAGGQSFQYFLWAQTGARLYYPTSYQDTAGAGIDTGGNQARGSTQVGTRGRTSLSTMNSAQDVARVLAQKPDVVLLHGGTNDIAHGDLDAPALAADLRALIQQYLEGGVKYVVVDTIIPHNPVGDTGWSSAMETCRLAVNHSIRNFSSSDARIRVADVASGAWDLTATLRTYYPDGVHPNFAGMRIMADIQTPVVNSLFSDAVDAEIAKFTDAANLLLANGTNEMTGTSGMLRSDGTGSIPTGQVATGWSVRSGAPGISCTCSKSVLADGSAAQRIVLSGMQTSPRGGISLFQNLGFAASAGENWEQLLYVELAAGSANLRSLILMGGANGGRWISLSAGTTVDMSADGLSGVLRTRCISPVTSAGAASNSFRLVIALGNSTNAATTVDLKVGKPIFRRVAAAVPQ